MKHVGSDLRRSANNAGIAPPQPTSSNSPVFQAGELSFVVRSIAEREDLGHIAVRASFETLIISSRTWRDPAGLKNGPD